MSRYERDFYSNPTFEEVMASIRGIWDKENITLRSCGRGESEANFNHQTGVVDGIERVMLYLSNAEKKALDDPGAGDST